MNSHLRVSAEAGAGPSLESLAEPTIDGLTDEVKTVLALLAELHEQTLALVEALTEINEQTYQPALEFLRGVETRARGPQPRK
jgi:hypothetical protein